MEAKKDFVDTLVIAFGNFRRTLSKDQDAGVKVVKANFLDHVDRIYNEHGHGAHKVLVLLGASELLGRKDFMGDIAKMNNFDTIAEISLVTPLAFNRNSITTLQIIESKLMSATEGLIKVLVIPSTGLQLAQDYDDNGKYQNMDGLQAKYHEVGVALRFNRPAPKQRFKNRRKKKQYLKPVKNTAPKIPAQFRLRDFNKCDIDHPCGPACYSIPSMDTS
jgi:hypothetical protein